MFYHHNFLNDSLNTTAFQKREKQMNGQRIMFQPVLDMDLGSVCILNDPFLIFFFPKVIFNQINVFKMMTMSAFS